MLNISRAQVFRGYKVNVTKKDVFISVCSRHIVALPHHQHQHLHLHQNDRSDMICVFKWMNFVAIFVAVVVIQMNFDESIRANNWPFASDTLKCFFLFKKNFYY